MPRPITVQGARAAKNRERARELYAKHRGRIVRSEEQRERAAQAAREWYAQNRERAAAAQRARNLAKRLAKGLPPEPMSRSEMGKRGAAARWAKYPKLTPEEKREKQKKWLAENREHRNTRDRAWWAKNRERIRVQRNARRRAQTAAKASAQSITADVQA